MEKKRIFIVEDDPIIASDLEGIIKDIGYDVCGVSHQPFEAKKKIESLLPDLLLLDINLGSEIDGIDLATLIKNHNIGIVFISAFTDKNTVERVKSVNPLGYIIKPFTEKEIEVTLELVFSSLNKEKNTILSDAGNDFIFVKTKNNLSVKIRFDEILFLEAFDNYAFIHTGKEKLLVSFTLKDLEKRINASFLIRVHRSFIINCNKVDAIHNNCLMIAKNEIPIGKSYKNDVLKFFPTL
ncbi:MAG: hypothetical protein A2W91_04100 [Bacteroidetes bacterium GWF2_38_335]|nr:MAG: hypothetical protein A2W91_04100 [Bacteroidetes bacterium GWF2_38_335]OFY79133.1 MAG: hypothetical protein A2281_03435 [Bacteroidetes bacterium RIFOXYA12_FULL_38_20]HBS88780.1 hypothetical protein [Bacteroidales bacterium]